MRRIFSALGAVLEVLVLIAMCAIHYFGHVKMGMARTLVFLNDQVRQVVDPKTLAVASLVASLVLACVYVAVLVKRKPHAKVEVGFGVAAVALFVGQASFMLAVQPSRDRAYLVVVLALTLAQLLNTLSGVLLNTRPHANLARC